MSENRPYDHSETPPATHLAKIAAAGALHPECPDVARLAPNATEGALRALATRVELDNEERGNLWGRGFTRRQVIAGAGAVGVASLGTQLATTRASFAAQAQEGALVVIFLRGGMDGLSVVVPADDPDLAAARPDIAVPGNALLPLDRGFGLHPALEPLKKYWDGGQLTAVPAVATPDLSRSHFQAQDCLERGGADTGATNGWLDRALEKMGSGTTFRAIGQGTTLPRSLIGEQPAVSLRSVDAFKLAGPDNLHAKTVEALRTLYTGWEHPLAGDAETALSAVEIMGFLAAPDYQPEATYPEGDFGSGMSEIARMIKGDIGLRLATIDVGGWDMHTNLGKVDQGAMQNHLGELGQGLDAFAEDLGGLFDDVTIVMMSEFGRRIEQNANHGADHGHGGVVLLMGGGLAGKTVHGDWQGLAPETRDQGDVPGLNDYRDVLGEVVSAKLGVSAADLTHVFPDHQVSPLGIMA
jgi:uncharacterized protein (DUF1501 family)